MCKESVQLEILKRSEIPPPPPKKKSARPLPFYRNREEKHFVSLLGLTCFRAAPNLPNKTI